MKTTDLTIGERLLLERRRLGETQLEAAGRHGVTRYRYRAWELALGATNGAQAPLVRLGPLAAHEVCYVRRRRAGASVADLAAQVGVTPWWLTSMEAGEAPVDRLAAYWKRRRRRR